LQNFWTRIQKKFAALCFASSQLRAQKVCKVDNYAIRGFGSMIVSSVQEIVSSVRRDLIDEVFDQSAGQVHCFLDEKLQAMAERFFQRGETQRESFSLDCSLVEGEVAYKKIKQDPLVVKIRSIRGQVQVICYKPLGKGGFKDVFEAIILAGICPFSMNGQALMEYAYAKPTSLEYQALKVAEANLKRGQESGLAPVAIEKLAQEKKAAEESFRIFEKILLDEVAVSNCSPGLVSQWPMFHEKNPQKIKGISMEVIKGPKLFSLIPVGSVPLLSNEYARNFAVGLQLCQVLANMHAAGFVHLDIKEDNVLLGYNGDGLISRLIDFGVSRKIGARVNEVGPFCYTQAEDFAKPLMDSMSLARLLCLLFYGEEIANTLFEKMVAFFIKGSEYDVMGEMGTFLGNYPKIDHVIIRLYHPDIRQRWIAKQAADGLKKIQDCLVEKENVRGRENDILPQPRSPQDYRLRHFTIL
jgi:hypothetical protein